MIDALVIGEWKRPSVKPIRRIYDAFHPLALGSEEEDHVRSLQTALKRLGFYHGRIDGDFGRGTRLSVQEAQHDLGIRASGEVDDETAEAITELLFSAFSGERWKLPRKDDAEVEVPEGQAGVYRSIMEEVGIPPYFAQALAEQESGSDHFDSDGFVKMRCEFWYQYQRDEEEHPDYEIRYRSFGIMSSPTPLGLRLK